MLLMLAPLACIGIVLGDEASLYGLGSLGSNGCHGETKRIETEAECKSASAILGYTWQGAKAHPNYPKGCTADFQTDRTIVMLNTHSTGSAQISSRPVCQTTEYGLGLMGGNVCPDGSSIIAAEAECKSAADSLGYSWDKAKAHPNYPKGCTADFQTDRTIVMLNTHATGAGKTLSSPLCQRTSAPTLRPTQAPRCGGEVGEFQCWAEVGSCDNPDFDMDECREVSFNRGRTDATSFGVCRGSTVGASTEVGAPGGIASTQVSAELSTEVCSEYSTETSADVAQTVKVPGVKGKRTVACARGVAATLNGHKFVSYRSGAFTTCADSCPPPRCSLSPDEIGTKVEAPGQTVSRAGRLQGCVLVVLGVCVAACTVSM